MAKTFTGVAYERSYVVMKPAEVRAKYDCDGAELGLCLETLVDEHGETLKTVTSLNKEARQSRLLHFPFS